MKNLLYIHGYNSSGNAFKYRLLCNYFPQCNIISPTLDYYHRSPKEILTQLDNLINPQKLHLIVGSSLGGYYAICCSARHHIPVLLVNPATNPLILLQGLIHKAQMEGNEKEVMLGNIQLAEYKSFHKEVFSNSIPNKEDLNFALSTDDKLLGNHAYLEQMYPEYNKKIYKDNSGHHFIRFEEIMPDIAELIGETI